MNISDTGELLSDVVFVLVHAVCGDMALVALSSQNAGGHVELVPWWFDSICVRGFISQNIA